MFFSLFIFLCCFPFCFPVVLPYCIPRCTTPSLGRSPRANRWKNDDLGLVPIFKKQNHKNLWFPIFSFDLYTNSILKQLNKLKNIKIFFFHFSFFSVVSRFVSPLCFSIVFPVALPRRWVEVLEPFVEKWWLRTCAHLQKEIFHKNLWFSIFSFDWYTDSILKQLNKLKNINMFFSLFIFLCCFPFCFPVVLPYCIPRCTTPSLGRSPRANRWKNDDLGLVPIFNKKYFTKICDFPFFPSISIQTVF